MYLFASMYSWYPVLSGQIRTGTCFSVFLWFISISFGTGFVANVSTGYKTYVPEHGDELT